MTGEIIICPAMAQPNAKIYGVMLAAEIDLYIIHGILHLLGYDDHKESDVKRMRRREARIMTLLARDRKRHDS